MGLAAVLLTALALAMDAFSIALSKGLATERLRAADGLKIGITFGGFQALMPLLGWLVGSRFSSFINDFSGYIGFALLAFIGGKMLYEALSSKSDEQCVNLPLTFRSLIIYGVATSIDAMAVGLTFSLSLPSFDYFLTVLLYCAIIGVVTLVISFAGYLLGSRIGELLGSKGELLGGIVLIILGVRMLIEQII